MSKLKLISLLPLCALLVACSTLNGQSKPPLIAPTNNLVPTVSCGQHAPDLTLPDYPAPSADLNAFVTAQLDWATKASGVFQSEKVLRHNTATCLDALESKGLILEGN